MGMTPGVLPSWARWRPVVLAWVLWALAILCLAAIAWFDHLLRQAGRPELVQLNASGIPFVLAALSATTVGAVLAGRRPAHPVGWLLLGSKALLPRPLHPPFQSVPNPFAVHVLVGPLMVVWGVASIVTSLGLVVAAASLVVRFRRAGGMDWQQLRWVALTAGLSTLAVPVAVAGQVLGNNT